MPRFDLRSLLICLTGVAAGLGLIAIAVRMPMVPHDISWSRGLQQSLIGGGSSVLAGGVVYPFKQRLWITMLIFSAICLFSLHLVTPQL